jgi:hypothetical protein
MNKAAGAAKMKGKQMKIKTSLALFSALGLLTTAAVAQPGPDQDSPAGGPPRQNRDRPQRPMRFDPEARKQALLDKYDTNKNGKLDDSEYIAIGKDVENGSLPPWMAGPPQGGPRFGNGRGPGGPNGPGGPGGPGGRNGPGFGPRHQEIMDQYDVNHDGKLDATEREAIQKDIDSGKLPPPPRGGGRGFGPPPGGPGGPPPPDAGAE